jgi:hypothetical protein
MKELENEKIELVKEISNSILKLLDDENSKKKKINEENIIELSQLKNNIFSKKFPTLSENQSYFLKNKEKYFEILKIMNQDLNVGKSNSIKKIPSFNIFKRNTKEIVEVEKKSEEVVVEQINEKYLLKNNTDFKNIREMRRVYNKNKYDQAPPTIKEYDLYKNLSLSDYLAIEKYYYLYEVEKLDGKGFLEKTSLILNRHNLLPTIIEEMIEYIENECERTIGLFRTPGHSKSISEMKILIQNGSSLEDILDSCKISKQHSICSLLKNHIRDLPVSVIPDNIIEEYIKTIIEKDEDKKLQTFKILIQKLPNQNRKLLKRYLLMFTRIIQNGDVSSNTLGKIFGSNLTKKENVFLEKNIENLNLICVYIIDNYIELFCNNDYIEKNDENENEEITEVEVNEIDDISDESE